MRPAKITPDELREAHDDADSLISEKFSPICRDG